MAVEIKATAREDVIVEIQLACAECGGMLDGEWVWKHDTLRVDPCQTCLQNAEEAGIEAAMKEG